MENRRWVWNLPQGSGYSFLSYYSLSLTRVSNEIRDNNQVKPGHLT